MSAMRAESSIPSFKTEVYVDSYADVEISPKELQEQGWVYVGKAAAKGTPTEETALMAVHRWHDENHEDPWRWCRHELCYALRDREHQL